MSTAPFRIIAAAFLFITILGCSNETKLIYPPEDVVNRVTDFYLFKDGTTFMYLNSNMNRKYDFGSIVIMEIDNEGEMTYIDSIIVPSLAGKMAVNSEESMIYVTSRDRHGIVRVKISGKAGAYRLSYIDDTDGDIPEILKTQKEPYAIILNEDEDKLFVTHLLNGEFSIVDLEKWELLETHKLKYGVTDIAYDAVSGYYLTSHRSSGNITLVEPSESLSGFNVGITETEIDLPTDGYDIRSLKASSDGVSFYASFQNYSDDSDKDSAPQLLKFKLAGKKSTETELIKTIALKGSLGEISVLPYVTGSDENEYNGELIFITSPGQKSLYIVDSERDEILDQIKFDKCEPYQVCASSTGNTTGLVLVSCFAQDTVYLYSIDIDNKDLYKEIGGIK
ncbi:MAG TPA: hypothetical protein PLX56_05455 [bacterium]|nr:hypothetical protein [bacterium]HQN71784.1 hypothetical protein [bacterium]HQO91761.1 hypothetical protein [bacterium]